MEARLIGQLKDWYRLSVCFILKKGLGLRPRAEHTSYPKVMGVHPVVCMGLLWVPRGMLPWWKISKNALSEVAPRVTWKQWLTSYIWSYKSNKARKDQVEAFLWSKIYRVRRVAGKRKERIRFRVPISLDWSCYLNKGNSFAFLSTGPASTGEDGHRVGVGSPVVMFIRGSVLVLLYFNCTFLVILYWN